MAKLIGICGFYREHQFSSGVYSFVENLLRGFAHNRGMPGELGDFEPIMFHGRRGLRWNDARLTYHELSDTWGRYPAETRVGLVDSAGLDAMLFPNFYTPPIVRSRRVATVIHDLQYLHLPEHWPAFKRLWMRTMHELTLRRADAVIAISQTVKADILNHYGNRWESRVHAIWNPVSIERFGGSNEQSFTQGRPYILCTAVDRPAKNLSTLIRAYAILRKRFPDYRLVMAGQLRSQDRTWRRKSSNLESKLPSTTDLVALLGLEKDVVLTGFVSDEQLGAPYRGASMFVLPSLFEGFGMPAVEALALGAPTLVSDLPVLREVTLNGACYVSNPLDEHEMASRMVDIIEQGNAARPTVEFCQDLQKRFSPETIARSYLKILLDKETAS